MKGRATTLFWLAAMTSCAGDGLFVDASAPPPAAPTLSAIQSAVFTPRCALSGCHVGSAAPFGLDLSEGRAWADLVGVPSAELAGFERVQAGDAAGSYLVLKLEGDPRILGDRMPLGGPYLSAEDIDTIRAWIDAGASDD